MLVYWQQEGSVPDASLVSLSAPSPHASRVYVTLADLDGWDIFVEIDGCIVLTEHCTDWHRVERRRATLAGDLGRAWTRRVVHAAAAA